jgi:hypothetical protein
MLKGAVLGAVVMLPPRSLSEISVINFLNAVVSMEEICPRNIHEYYVGFRLECNIRIIENLNCRKRCFARFVQQLFFNREDAAKALGSNHGVATATDGMPTANRRAPAEISVP